MTQTQLARDDVAAVVHEVIESILPGATADPDLGRKHLKELGADSVDRVEIILAVMDRLRVDRPMSTFSAIPDVDSLVTYLWETTRHD